MPPPTTAAVRNPAPGVARSITAPHSGAPSALPTVDIVPLQPMTSPRRPSGTSRTSVALIDESAGAHGSPATTTATASQTWPGRERGGDAWRAPGSRRARAATACGALAPWTRPPITEPPAHSAIIQPTSAERPASLSVATRDTSVPTSTKAAATPGEQHDDQAGRQQPAAAATSSATGAGRRAAAGRRVRPHEQQPGGDGQRPDDGQRDRRRRLRREQHPDDRREHEGQLDGDRVERERRAAGAASGTRTDSDCRETEKTGTRNSPATNTAPMSAS